MSDHIEHPCGKCGSLLHHADDCPAVAARPQDDDYRIECHNCGRPVNYVYCPYCGADPDAAPQEAAPQARKVDYDCVICPACTHQFRAIPVNVQQELGALRVAASPAGQWVSVQERMPEIGVYVLARWDARNHDNGNTHAVACWNGGYWQDDECDDLRDPTHWMPLPASPEPRKP